MKIRFLAGGIVLVASLGFLIVSSLQSGTMQSVPVNNLRAKDNADDSFVGRNLRVVGFVSAKPVKKTRQQTEDGVLNVSSFEVLGDEKVGEKSRVLVSYTDALPDTFRAGGPVQVDGTYVSPGVFKAEHVLTKCPSKYQAEEAQKSEKAKATTKVANAKSSKAPQKSL